MIQTQVIFNQSALSLAKPFRIFFYEPSFVWFMDNKPATSEPVFAARTGNFESD